MIESNKVVKDTVLALENELEDATIENLLLATKLNVQKEIKTN